MLIDKNKIVTMSYQMFQLGVDGQAKPGLVEDKTVDDPAEFLFGNGQLLPDVAAKIEKQTAGFQTTLILEPDSAFGPYRDDLVQWYDKANLPKEPEVQIGMKFQTQGPTGDVMAVMVTDIKDDKVLLDGNHPLAGLFIQFDINVLRVREATESEASTGQIEVEKYH